MKECKYCNGEKGNCPAETLISAKIPIGIFGEQELFAYVFDDPVEGYELCAEIGYQFESTIKIKYCPMCGRKL